MIITKLFENISEPLKIWIYASDKILSFDNQYIIRNELNVFTSTWMAHDQKLNAYFSIVYDRFIILAVNENMAEASGCSIDSSVKLLKKIGAELNLNFFDFSKLYFNSNNNILQIPYFSIQEFINNGTLNTNTLYFDMSISHTNQLVDNMWPIYLNKSTLGKKYFQNIPV